MAVEKFYKGADGQYYKVVQQGENLTAKEESTVRNRLNKNLSKKNKTKTTTKGRKIYKDKEGNNYSERTTSFKMDNGKWITIPTVNDKGGQYNQRFLEDYVRRNGPKDPLTGEEIPTHNTESEAISYAKRRSDSLVPERPISRSLYTNSGKFRGADYKTGVKGFWRRWGLSGDNFKEKSNALDKTVGKDGYVVDRLGNFLLTPKGREKIGQPGKNLLAVDSSKFEGAEDIADFLGEFAEVTAGSIAGEIAAQRYFAKQINNKGFYRSLFRKGMYGKTYGAFRHILNPAQKVARTGLIYAPGYAGAAAGAYVGNVLHEVQQYARQINDEPWKSINDRGEYEAKLAGAASVLGNMVTRGIGRVIKTKAAEKQTRAVYGDKAYDEWLETGILKADERSVMGRIEKGLIVDLWEEIGSSNRARAIAFVEQITKNKDLKDIANARTILKLMRKEFGESIKDFSDDQIINTVKLYAEGKENTLTKALDLKKKEVAGSIADSLSAMLKLAQKGEVPIDNMTELYDVVNQAAGISGQQAIKRAEVLGEHGFKNIDDLFVNLDEALDVMNARVRDVKGSSDPVVMSKMDYLKGLKGNQYVDDLRFLVDESGDVVFVTQGGAQNFINTTNVAEELGKIKKQFGNRGIDVLIEEGGPLEKLWKNLDEDGNVINNLYISPNESNLLVQQFRRINLEGLPGSKFDTKKLWDAAVRDNDIATAALDNVINLANKGKIKPSLRTRIKSGQGPSAHISRNTIAKGLRQLDEYTAAVKSITKENKAIKDMFEEYGLGELAIRVAKGEKNYKNMADALLDVEAPENLESFLKFFTETVKKQKRAINQASKAASDEYTELVNEGAIEPLKTTSGAQRRAIEAVESGPMDSQVSKVDYDETGRTGTKIADEEKINFVDSDMSLDEMENFVKNEIKTMAFRRMINDDGQISLKNVQQIINKLGGNNIGAPKIKGYSGRSSLQIIFGDDTAKELLEFSRQLGQARTAISRSAQNNPLITELDKKLGQLNDIFENFTGNNQSLDDALKAFNKTSKELDQLNNQEFYQNLKNNNYDLGFTIDPKTGEVIPDVDFFQFTEDLFSDKVSTPIIKKVVERLREKNPKALDALRGRVMDKFLKDVGFEDLTTDTQFIKDVDRLLTDENIKRVIGKVDPKRWDIIFGDSIDKNPFKQFEKLKTMKQASRAAAKSSTMGTILAAAYAVRFAGIPLTLASAFLGSPGLFLGVAGLTAGFASMKGLSNALRNPKILKILAETRLPHQATRSRDISEAANAIAKILNNMAREQEDEFRQLGKTSRSKLPRSIRGRQQSSEGVLGKAVDTLKGTKDLATNVVGEAMAVGPNIPRNFANLIEKGLTGESISNPKKSTTPLPRVNTFDDTIYSELERRRALAGNNPKNQDLVRRR